MLHQIKERLEAGWSDDADAPLLRIEGFVSHGSRETVLGLHAFLLLLAGLVGFWQPLLGTVACSLITVSLVAEGTGRISAIRWLLPWKVPSYNLAVRLPAERPIGTVVIAAPLDTPRWRPAARTWFRRPLRAVLYAAVFVAGMCALRTLAEPWGAATLGLYIGALLVLGATLLFAWAANRRVETGRSEASGPAVLMELLRRLEDAPPPEMDIWCLFTGCGYAYQGGMDAFLAKRGEQLRDPVLVVAMEAPGRAPVSAAVSEGQLWAQHYRSTGPALVERMVWAGVRVPIIDKAGVTDALAATRMGYRALALCGGPGEARPEHALRAADIAEFVVRWFGEDVHRLAGHLPALESLRTQLDPPALPEDPEPEPVEERELDPVEAAE